MGYIQNLINDVNKTHKSFGNLVAFLQVASKARKVTLVVSPSGCGKSKAMEFIARNTTGSYSPTSLSIASLANKTELLTSFRSVIVIDDIAVIQTSYGRKTTISTLSALVYQHRVEPSMAGFDFVVEDFYGSALIGIQPIMLRDLILSAEWDTNIRDKTIRYYHLQRPLEPNLDFPVAQIEQGLSIDDVNDFIPDTESGKWQELVSIARSQWSRARVTEHLKDLLKCVSALENRKDVVIDDYDTLLQLIKPMEVEKIVVVKEDLEGLSYLDNNLLSLLVEYLSYGGEFSLAHLEIDFQVSVSQAYKIMQSQNGYWQQVSKSPTIYRPSKKLIALLKECNMEVKNEI